MSIGDRSALNPRDTAFEATIDMIYSAVHSPEGWPRALQAVADYFGDVGTIMIYASEDGAVGSIVSPSLEEAQRVHVTENWSKRDLRFERAYERGYFSTIDAITDRHIATDQEMATHPYYQDFLLSQGLRWFGGISISPDPSMSVALSVQRSTARPPFSDQELERLIGLGRHVENALRFSIRMIAAESAQTALADTLDQLRAAVFLLDRNGAVLFRNDAGNRLLGRELLEFEGRLAAMSQRHDKILREAVEAACLKGADAPQRLPKPTVIPHRSGDGFLAAYVIPVPPKLPDMGERLLEGVRAIAVVTSSEPGAPLDPTLVRDLLGLTLGEARVAALIAAGLPIKETSEKLGIAENTVKTHLRRIFQKSGVSRQSDLTSVLNRMTLR